MKYLTLIALFLLTLGQGFQANQKHSIPGVKGKIMTDGIMDEALWKNALKLELNFEVNPGENIAPPVKTEVFLAYNKTHLFVAFKAYDPKPNEILARISDRDNIGNEDWVAVILDTFNDQRRDYALMCNPYGVQSDFIETENGNGGDWDAIWDSGGKITHFGYLVEMSIPFSSLRFQRKKGVQTWGFDAVRMYPRNTSHQIGAFPRDRNNNCYLCQAIKLQGFEGIKPGENIELNPTVSFHNTELRENDTNDSFTGTKKFDAGFTARWGITNNLTLGGTINPDFSQIEADQMQLNINNPFALYFQEKRPFFTEGSDYFNTRINAVYTRSMQDPHWGIKLTGKEGTHTLGGYIVRDNVTNLIFPGSEGSKSTSLAMDSSAGIFRYKKDFGSNYTLGLLFTNRQGEEYHNNVLGLDGDFKFSSKDTIRFQFLGSNTKYPTFISNDFSQPKDNFSDSAMDFQYLHVEKNILFYGGYNRLGENFRADLGFIPRVGYQRYYGGFDYRWYAKPGKWWTKFVAETDVSNLVDLNGNLLDRNASVRFHYQGPMQMFSFIGYQIGEKAFNGSIFKTNQFSIQHQMTPTGDLYTRFNLSSGKGIDYANSRTGRNLNINMLLDYSIGKHLKFIVTNNYEKMRVDNNRLYIANISQLRAVYQFNKKTFIRAILQYVDYRYNTEMYTSEIGDRDQHLFTQFLFSYKINPRTVLFLGYSDNYFNNLNNILLQSDRTLYLKIGYALTL